MKKDDQSPPIFDDPRFRVCHWCGYDANPGASEFCEVCERPLDPKAATASKRSRKLRSGVGIRLLSLGILVLLAGGTGYWLLRDQTSPPSSAPSSPAIDISSASDIRLYQTLQDVPNVPKGLFNYSSALAFAAITKQGMNDKIRQAHSEFQLRYTEPSQGNPGSTTAIKMLIDGEVSIAQSARPLEDEELNRARSRQLTLEQIPVAIDGIVFYSHPDINIPGLSINQAQDIFSGKVTNWRELGGPDLPIVPISLDPKAVSSPKQALGDVAEKMGANVQIIRDHTEGVRRVANTPGAISFGGGLNIIGQKMIRLVSIAKANSNQYVSPVTPSGEVDKQAFRNGTYPITRRLFIVIRRNASLDEQAGVAYANLLLSGEGQRIIENAGFVSLY